MDSNKLELALNQFYGTGAWHPLSVLFRNVMLTDGVKYLADEAGAYWLMDAIASYLPTIPSGERFLVAQFSTYKNTGNLLLVDDAPADIVYAEQQFEYTDFPLETIKFYVVRDGEYWVIMLPSEY